MKAGIPNVLARAAGLLHSSSPFSAVVSCFVFRVSDFVLLCLAGWLLAAGLCVPASAALAEADRPVSRTPRNLQGWTIQVDDRLLAPPNEEAGREAMAFLDRKLADICAVVGAEPLARLQAVTIVLDLNHGKLRCMQYHPEADWLQENGYSTNLVKCVHIPVLSDLVTPRNINEQPWVVLHELAHAYHDQVLGFEEPRVLKAFGDFQRSGHGDQALLYDGSRVKHYGLTDQKEFFAEMTEAYFGENDFFPFNRAELMTAEPGIYALLREIWGPLASARPAAAKTERCDWKGIAWIGDGSRTPTNVAAFYEDDPAPQFRKAFRIEGDVQSARLCIAGLGYYEARVNGRPVAETALAPLWTSYDRRVLYDTYDVSKQIRRGENVLGVTLGNGWYNPLPLNMWGRHLIRDALAVGRPCLILKLELRMADGSVRTVVSDTSWKVAGGGCLRNNIYLGEVFDARRETPGWDAEGFDDKSWTPAVPVAGPGGSLEPREAPPVAVRERWPAAAVTEPRSGVYVVDMGRNFAGIARFRFGEGAAGERIRLRYGELLNGDGTVNVMTTVCGQIKRKGVGGPGAPDVAEQSDVFVRRGGGDESYAPRFTWHGFRYVQVEGLSRRPAPADVEAVAIASALQDAGEFECSNALFNDIHRVCRNTFLSNVFGVQSDCPARERFAYGADIAVTAEAFLLNFDMRSFYRKTVQDFADANVDGWFTMTAPYLGIADRGLGGRAAAVCWTVGVPVLLEDLYRYHGDRESIARHYDACARYVTMVKGKFPDLIVPVDIGDHEALADVPSSLPATAEFYHWARQVSEFATILDKEDDARRYGALAEEIRGAFRKRFVKGGRVGRGGQSEQVFGLYHRLVPDADRAEALKILQDDLAAHGGGPTTGIFGTRYLLEVLSAEGLEEAAGRLAARREFPGWGYMLDQGATTLWETWATSDDVFSRNHPMFGSVDEWLIKHVLGIAPAEDAVGFDKAVVRPMPVAGVTWARGGYRSPKGWLRVSWRVEGGKTKLQVEVPRGMTARVWLEGEERWVDAAAGRHEW